MSDAPVERVLGWDVLRGLSALAVALYHLLYWQGVAIVYTYGSYGVYLFFFCRGRAWRIPTRSDSGKESCRIAAFFGSGTCGWRRSLSRSRCL
jgi:hypothetical protein